MNRRDFLKGLSLLAGTALAASAIPSALAEVIPVTTGDLPPFHPNCRCIVEPLIEIGYSKLRIEVIHNLRRIYRYPWCAQLPIDVITTDKRILFEFDVPPPVAHLYEPGQILTKDTWPHVSNLYPTQLDILFGHRETAIVKAEWVDPGDGIDTSIIESVMMRSNLK